MDQSQQIMNQNPQDFEKLRQFLSVNRAVENLKNVIPIETSFNTQQQSRINEYKQKLKQCQENNQKFTDTEFPPIETSLSYSNFEKLSVSKKQIWKQIQWLRPSEFLDKNQQIHIFEKPFGSSANVIEPNDIRQGKLGNCYFLSALSSIAEQPKLIKRLFTSSEYNEFGIYAIWLHVNGEWKQIIIDDYIPCYNGQPIFSKNTGNEIWVMLIEKAYAKAYGSYEIIDQGGNPAYALKELTGAPCFNFDKNKQLTGQQQEQEFWNFVSKNFRNEYVITCYTEMTGKQDQENALGLLSGHSYAILRAEQVVSSAGKSERIFKIRNPWASKEWRGDWADDSYLWTQELRKLLEVEQKDDGCFWINTKDFTKYFLGIGVCKVNDGFKFNSINLNTDIQEQFMVRVKVERDSHLLISLNQIDQKMFKNDPDYKYAFLQVLAGKMNQQNQSLDFMEGDFKQERSVSIESQFQKGDYIVLISVRQFPKYKHKMVLWLRQLITRKLITSNINQIQ
ncbi:hypothetical protein PPERSA_04375 [Pseudocohnilembus persalinus]|uniref:Calpain catalytic domain-containing protein n=1 Tax=Pseudocohnilembus persalinus TaxID=266149 RepID=A0A0V0QRB2_PSEPJ|nr:hypothetical protein PPERSA_04375 [Pseudocohnilembus persalinus]|eukprot:KRX04560.1 hypothetical protein PPERSA_04375 [Pseudocohnilembus persalinus]